MIQCFYKFAGNLFKNSLNETAGKIGVRMLSIFQAI